MSQSVEEAIGTVVSLWRYPVKSMMGEELNAAEVSERGLLGDPGAAQLLELALEGRHHRRGRRTHVVAVRVPGEQERRPRPAAGPGSGHEGGERPQPRVLGPRRQDPLDAPLGEGTGTPAISASRAAPVFAGRGLWSPSEMPPSG